VFSGFGPTELIIVLVIVLLIFGPKRLPGLGRQLGAGMREFKESITGRHDADDDDDSTAGEPAKRADARAELGRPEGDPVPPAGDARTPPTTVDADPARERTPQS
jgi:sec-independent protein translocase protein TatA